jgi:hypothetical protein
MKGIDMRRLGWTLIALAVGMALPAGCGGDDGEEPETVVPPEERTAEGEAPTESELAGIWWMTEPGIDRAATLLVRFSPDGTFAIDDGGRLDTTPAAAGTYELDGEMINFESSGSELCTEGDTWALEAGVPAEGELHTVVREDADEECSLGVGTQWRLTRVSPSSPPGVEITGEPGEDAVPPQDAETLAGIWLLEGSGRLLRFGRDGSYATDDAGGLGTDPADIGTVELDRDGTLIFTSGRRSRGCSEGDRWVWEGVEIAVAPATRPDPEAGEGGLAVGGDWTLSADVTGDDCDHAIPDDARWLRISH